jgi:hypothetical protein
MIDYRDLIGEEFIRPQGIFGSAQGYLQVRCCGDRRFFLDARLVVRIVLTFG